MADFIENPRRHPRIAFHCALRVAFRAGGFVGTQTFDLCPAVFLSGTVVWSSDAPPWRSGIAFDHGSACVASRLVEQLTSAYPDVGAGEPYIARISADALLTPTPIPGKLSVVAVEAEILSAIGSGVEARTLRDRLGERWAPCVKGVFALLGRGAIQVELPPR